MSAADLARHASASLWRSLALTNATYASWEFAATGRQLELAAQGARCCAERIRLYDLAHRVFALSPRDDNELETLRAELDAYAEAA